MATIRYEDLFDFPGYNKAIKDAESANKEFGKTVEMINNRIAQQYNEISKELAEYMGVLKSFNVNQKSAADSIIRTGDAALSAQKKIQEQKRVMMELVGTTDLTTHSVNELKTGLKGLEAEYTTIAGRSDDARAKKAALAAEARRLKGALKEETDMLKITSKTLQASEGSYQALSLEMANIGKQLKAMPDAFNKTTGQINVNNKAAVDLSKRYLEINTVLKTADSQLGNYQRNVGNYASGFQGLNTSFSQLTRELPALGINIQTFFLAISNNLPIFFDQIKQTKDQIAAMRAEGLKAPTMLQAMGKAIFSLQSLMSIGITLLTLYGARVIDTVGSLFKGKKAFSETAESAKLLKSAMEDTNFKKAVTEVNELTTNIDLAKKGLLSKKDVLKQYNETIGVTTGTVKSLDEAEKALTKNGPAYIQMMLLKAAANLALQKAADLALKAEQIRNVNDKIKPGGDALGGAKLINDLKKSLKSEADAAEGEYKGLLDIQKKFQSDAAKIASDNKFNFFGDQFADKSKKNDKNTLDDKIKKQQDLLKSALDKSIALEELRYQQGLISEEAFQINKLELIKKYAAAAIELENKRKKPDQKVVNDFNTEKIKAETEYEKFANDLSDKTNKANLERQIDSIKILADKKVQALLDEKEETLSAKRYTDQEREALELDYQNRIDAILITSLEKRIKLETDATKRAQLEKEKAELERGVNTRNRAFDEKAIEDKYKVEINAAKRAFDIIKAGRDTSFKEELAFLEKLKAIKIKYAKDTAEEELAIAQLKADYERQLREELEETIYMGIQAGVDIAQNIVDGKFEERIANLEGQKKRELDLAGNNAAARAAIEEKFQKKIADQKNKQAKADRAFALFNVAINTAQAISKTIATFGMPFATPFIVLAAIQGAIQAALILSKPLPKYKKGRKGGPAELAIVDEEGPEMIIDRSGRLKEVGGKGPRVTQLQSGDSVVTSTVTNQILKSVETEKIVREINLTNQLSGTIRQGKQDEMIYVMAKAFQSGQINQHDMQEAFEKAVKKIPVQNHIYDERGYRRRQDEVNSKTTYLNNLTKI